MTTPPPRPSASSNFFLPPLPSLALRNQQRQSLSSSFSFGPEGLMDHLSQGGEDQDDDLLGANNSSILPVSPRILPSHRHRDAHLRRKPSSLSISSSNASHLAAAAAAQSPARAQNNLGVPGSPFHRGATPLRSRLGQGPPVNGRGRIQMGEGEETTMDDDEETSMRLDHEGEDDVEEDREDWEKMVDNMRMWRHDAILQHLYETAAFWGDKVLSWTGDRNDAFWLAQIHFLTAQYPRALRILTHPLPPSRPPPSSSSSSSLRQPQQQFFQQPSVKGKERAHPLPPAQPDFLDEQERREAELIRGEGGILEETEDLWEREGALRGEIGDGNGERRKRLVDRSLPCRYLAAQCQVRMGQWQEALEMLGSSNPFAGMARSGPTIKSDGGMKLESSMCLLRGQIQLRLSSTLQAKESFLEALSLDVRCYDAFQALVGGEMMGVEEEWDMIQSLCYKEQTEECAEFIKMIYMTRLKKYKHLNEITIIRRRLEAEYALADNPDVLFALADTLYAQYKWNECYAVTSRILTISPSHPPTLPLHLACMHHLPRLRSALFLLSHQLADGNPDDAISWYAVGLWYYTGEKWGDARRYFGKAGLMNPRFGPAWIAFAHSFAMEKEHDQAITAYSTATRLFQGSHLPLLFIGMEHLQLQNTSIAGDNFISASTICQTDPLLFNERGVVAYTSGDYLQAISFFEQALSAAEEMQGTPSTWAPTHLNLGHAYRKAKKLDRAYSSYTEALRLDPLSDGACAGLGMIHHLLGNMDQSIEMYHEALSLAPQSPYVSSLLNLALDASITLQGPLGSIRNLPDALSRADFDPFPISGLPSRARSQAPETAADADADTSARSTGGMYGEASRGTGTAEYGEGGSRDEMSRGLSEGSMSMSIGEENSTMDIED